MPTVETNDISTYYEEYGSGPPLVVAHGATADHQAWAEVLQPLADDFRVLLYDLRGHGRTPGSPHDKYTPKMYADDLAAFIEALELDEPAILGHSLGGMIGYTFADRHPEKLSALITVGSRTPQVFTKGEWMSNNVFSPIFTPLMGNERIRNGFEWVTTQLFGEEAFGDQDELQRLRDAHECEIPEQSTDDDGKIGRGLRDYYNSNPSWQFPVVPFLVLYGENEVWMEHHARFLENELEHCRSREIPDAGHNAQADNPEFVRTQIQEFLPPE